MAPRLKSIVKLTGLILLGLVLAGMTGWGVLMIYYSNLPWQWLRTVVAGVFGLGTLAAFVLCKNRFAVLVEFLALFALLVVWFFLIPPSNHRDWQTEVAVLPSASINGDAVTIRNIRNFDYQTETDFTARYYDKSYDLKELDSVDLICVYWGSEAIAHVMVSFGFAGRDYLCFSIETRKERSEAYSTIKGFFRQFELFYVVADERDLIRVRTNYRRPAEQAYLYRTRIPRENQRKLFLDYLRQVNELAEKPAWYNTLTDNCTTGVLWHTRSYEGRPHYNWKLLFSGYTAQYAHEIGGLDSSLSFAELRQRSLINESAQAADQAEDFSQKIRQGIPLPQPLGMEEFLSGR